MKGIVLLGHGSRDPLWRVPIEAVAARVSARAPDVPVRCAYLELCPPALPQAIDELVTLGVDTLRVLPMFLGVGRHARKDLPQLVQAARARHPHLHVEVLAAVGEHAQVLDLFAEIAAT